MSGLHAARKAQEEEKEEEGPAPDRADDRPSVLAGRVRADRGRPGEVEEQAGHVARRLVPQHQAGPQGPAADARRQPARPDRRGRRPGAGVGRPHDPHHEPVPGADGLLLAPSLRERARRRTVTADAAEASRPVPAVLELRGVPERELPRPRQRRHRRPVDVALPDGRGQRQGPLERELRPRADGAVLPRRPRRQGSLLLQRERRQASREVLHRLDDQRAAIPTTRRACSSRAAGRTASRARSTSRATSRRTAAAIRATGPPTTPSSSS